MENDAASNGNASATDRSVSRGASLPQLSDTWVNDAAIKQWVLTAQENGAGSAPIQTDAGTGKTVDSFKLPPKLGIIQYPGARRPPNREMVLQEWEGQVEHISDAYFTATLIDLTAGDSEESEELELPLDDLSEGDRSLLVHGATFRWIIGYRYQDGQKERFTRLVIRRLPIWTEQEIKSADREAEELYNGLSRYSRQRAASA